MSKATENNNIFHIFLCEVLLIKAKEMKLEHTNPVSTTSLLKPVIIGIFIIPISLSLWICGAMWSNYPNTGIISAFIHHYTPAIYLDMLLLFPETPTGMSDRSPFRWFWATLLPAVISSKALQKKSLSLSGAVLGEFPRILSDKLSINFTGLILPCFS